MGIPFFVIRGLRRGVRRSALFLHPAAFSADELRAGTRGLGGLVGGEGNANDNTTTNNGVLEGGVSFVPGEVGQAFSFDGVSGFVVVPDSISLRLTNQITIECWINPSRIVGDHTLRANWAAAEASMAMSLP